MENQKILNLDMLNLIEHVLYPARGSSKIASSLKTKI